MVENQGIHPNGGDFSKDRKKQSEINHALHVIVLCRSGFYICFMSTGVCCRSIISLAGRGSMSSNSPLQWIRGRGSPLGGMSLHIFAYLYISKAIKEIWSDITWLKKIWISVFLELCCALIRFCSLIVGLNMSCFLSSLCCLHKLFLISLYMLSRSNFLYQIRHFIIPAVGSWFSFCISSFLCRLWKSPI